MRDILRQEYAVGMWGSALEEQLAWTVVDNRTSKRTEELQWRYPSWSWASVQGAIIPRTRLDFDRFYVVTDHDGKSISFNLQDKKRPPARRENSDSLKQELDMGLDEWRRAKLARGIGQLTGTSILPSGRLTSDSGAGVVRDNQPVLLSRWIAIRGHINYGTLTEGVVAGVYTLTVRNLAPTEEGTKWSDIELVDVIPDENPTNDDFLPEKCAFVVLRAKKTSPHRIFFGAQESELGNPVDESTIRYSGAGLLVISASDYMQRQQDKLKELEAKRTKPIDEALADQILHLRTLVTMLSEESAQVKEVIYYRTGVVRFHNLNKASWETLQKSDPTNFWLG